jgi:hypothetical protein
VQNFSDELLGYLFILRYAIWCRIMILRYAILFVAILINFLTCNAGQFKESGSGQDRVCLVGSSYICRTLKSAEPDHFWCTVTPELLHHTTPTTLKPNPMHNIGGFILFIYVSISHLQEKKGYLQSLCYLLFVKKNWLSLW